MLRLNVQVFKPLPIHLLEKPLNLSVNCFCSKKWHKIVKIRAVLINCKLD